MQLLVAEPANTILLKRRSLFLFLKNYNCKKKISLMIPGVYDSKHDIAELEEMYRKPFSSADEANEYLSNSTHRAELLRPFANYTSFVKRFTGQMEPAFATTKTFQFENTEIALLGVNSALMCFRGENKSDYGTLSLGEVQIHKLLKETESADVRIFVMHHPFSF